MDKETAMALKAGDLAPDFVLRSDTGDMVRLSDELKKQDYVVLAFFPAAFSAVCTNEMNIFQEALGEIHDLNAEVLGISTDNFYSLREFKERNGLDFPLLSDFHPRGAVASQFGTMETDGMTGRALFLVDQDRRICFVQAVERKVNPGVDKLLEKLEELAGEEEPWRATGTG